MDHGYSILKSDKLGNSDAHELGDRDLDMVNGIVPDIAKLLKRSEVELKKALPQVSCGGANADSCAECVPLVFRPLALGTTSAYLPILDCVIAGAYISLRFSSPLRYLWDSSARSRRGGFLF